MSKSASRVLFILNTVFLILNVIFLALGVAPEINFVAGLFCLAGMMASYMLYKEGE